VTAALPSRSAIADQWALDPRTVFLNHGSFGACSRPVLRAQARLRARLERQPVRFLARELDGLLAEARADLAAFVGADPDDIAFVPNATHGIATVLRSLRFRPGDELLISDHAYNAAANAVRFAAERDGARLVVASIPFPSAGPEEVIQRVLAAVTPRTRLAVLSHVTSPTALILPIERLATELTGRGVEVLIDGAHAPGMIHLDLRSLARAGVAYYTGNGHKWLGAPKGSAFLWVRPDRQSGIRPLAISHGANSADPTRSRFRLEADWTGTADPTPWLAMPAAIRFLGGLRPDGWPGLMAAQRTLALTGRDVLLDRLDVTAPAPADMIGSMASILLPIAQERTGASQALSPLDEDPLQRQLRERFAIEVPVLPWPQVWAAPDARPDRLIRISATPYDTAAEYRYLADALANLLGV
jgi:isopenicillin-N epimerase